MIRWYLTASGLTAFNPSLADQDLNRLLLILFVRNRAMSLTSTMLESNLSYSLSYYYIYHWWSSFSLSLFSDSSKLWKSFIFLQFSSECAFLVLVTHIIISSESGITPLLLNWKSSFNFFCLLWNICSELAFVKKSKKWECWLSIIFLFLSVMKTTSSYKVWFLLTSLTNDMLSDKTLIFVGCLCLWIVDRDLWITSISVFVLELEETS